MSLYIDLTINDGPLMAIAVTRQTGRTGDDAINTYRWVYYRDGGRTIGHVGHRYGDGAIVLARKVLDAITAYRGDEKPPCCPSCDGHACE